MVEYRKRIAIKTSIGYNFAYIHHQYPFCSVPLWSGQRRISGGSFLLEHKLIFKNTNVWSCTVASKRMSRTWLSGRTDFDSSSKEFLTKKNTLLCSEPWGKTCHLPLHFPTTDLVLTYIQFWALILWYQLERHDIKIVKSSPQY